MISIILILFKIALHFFATPNSLNKFAHTDRIMQISSLINNDINGTNCGVKSSHANQNAILMGVLWNFSETKKEAILSTCHWWLSFWSNVLLRCFLRVNMKVYAQHFFAWSLWLSFIYVISQFQSGEICWWINIRIIVKYNNWNFS